MDKHDQVEEFWYRGKITRRRWLGLGAAAAGALGAGMLVPPPWRSAFGQAKPYKIGTLQPLSGTASAGGADSRFAGRARVRIRSRLRRRDPRHGERQLLR